MKSTRNLIIRVMVGCLLTAGSVWGGGGSNGTVTIGSQVWLKDASCFTKQTWDQAVSSCGSLKSGSCGLTDGSTAGQWRLPTLYDLKTAYNTSMYSFTNVKSDFYWSSTTYDNYPDNARGVDFYDGGVGFYGKGNGSYVLCVR